MIILIINNNINKKYYTLVNNIKYYITKRCKNPYLTRTVTLTSKELSTQDKIEIVQELIYYSNIIQGEEKIEDEINTQQVIFEILDSLLTALRNEKLVEEEKSIAQARIEERNKIIADLSHYVKNMISSVIDPLENLKSETEIKPIIIQNALRGANLIREIVNAMNLSFKGSIDDFYYDAVHNTGKEKLDFKTILIESIKHSVGNMYDGKYFANFLRKYFPTKEIYKEAKSEWPTVSQSNDLNIITPFLQKHFFNIKMDIKDAEKFVMGNDKGSAIKMLILFQEIILNAVKYSAFVDKENRSLKIRFESNKDQIGIKVENSYKPEVKTKTTGIGHVIIDNFAKLLKTKPIINKNENIYSVEIKFTNFWESKIGKNRQDLQDLQDLQEKFNIK